MLAQTALVVSLATSALAQASGCKLSSPCRFVQLFSCILGLVSKDPLGSSPSDAPVLVDCPASELILRTGDPSRGNQVLQANESSYLERRRRDVTPQLWRNYLNDNSTGSTGYSVDEIVQQSPKMCVLARWPSTVPSGPT